jgi:two-component system sensor histidine kinase ChiS
MVLEWIYYAIMDGIIAGLRDPARIRRVLAFALIMCLMIMGVGGILVYVSTGNPPNAPRVVSGSIDLGSWDFSRSSSIPLSGDWAFLPRSFDFRSPGASRQPEGLAAVKVPGDWHGAMGSPYGYGLYALHIHRSPGQDGLALLVPDEAIAWSLFLDGDLRAESGRPAETADATLVRRHSVLVPLPDTGGPSGNSTGGETEVAIRVSNFSYDVGGLINPVLVGSSRGLAARMEARSALDGLVIGCLLVMALYHFILFVLRIDDRPSLYFCLFCFLLLLRSLAIGHYPERLVSAGPLGAAMFGLSTRVEYLCFYLGMPTYLAFALSLFPAESDRRVLKAALALGLAASALVLFAPVAFFMAWTTKPFQALTVLACIYALFVFGRAVARKRLGAIYGLVGFAAFFLIILNDILHANLLIRTAHLTPLGLMLFMVADSFIVSSRVASTFERERQLARELSEEKLLLDRRIAERTAELSASNERLRDMDRAKSRFLATISHELRTPITLIVSPLEQATRGAYGPSVPSGGDLMTRLLRNGYRVLNIIEGMFDFARLELGRLEPRLEPVDLASTLRFYAAELESLAEKKGIALSVGDDLEAPCEVAIDSRLFEIALFNILSNALKFTARGGRVRISAQGPLPDGRAAIAVSDTGIGIRPGLLPRIFDKLDWQADFSDRLYDGAGIGLSLSKKIVGLHGGEIRAESEEGRGSTFTILLPARKTQAAEAEVGGAIPGRGAAPPPIGGRAAALISGRARSILGEAAEGPAEAAGGQGLPGAPVLLIVEDNRELLEFMRERLGSRFGVRVARDGEEALRCLEAGLEADLVVTDVMMPRMDGNLLFREAKARMGERCPPFVFLTARSEAEERREALAEGAVDYLRKPFDVDELVLKVESLLAMRSRAREGAKRDMKEALARFLETEGGEGQPKVSDKAEEARRRREEALALLAPREAQIAALVAKGFQTKAIATDLGIAARTVSNALIRIYDKLGVESRLELIRLLEYEEGS